MSEALTHRFNLMIAPRQLAALALVSKSTGAPVAELIRRAIEKEHPSSSRTDAIPDVQDES